MSMDFPNGVNSLNQINTTAAVLGTALGSLSVALVKFPFVELYALSKGIKGMGVIGKKVSEAIKDSKVGNFFKSFGSFFKDSAKLIAGPKILKAFNAIGNMAKSLKGSVMGYLFEKLLEVLAPLADLLTPINIIFEMLGASIQALVGGILPSLIEAFMPIFEILQKLIPIMMDLGQKIGPIFAGIITKIFYIFGQFYERVLVPLMPLLSGFFNDVIVPIFSYLKSIFLSLYPLFEATIVVIFNLLGKIFEGLAWTWEHVLKPVWDALTEAFKFTAKVFAMVINAINDAVQEMDVFDVIPDFSVAVPALAEGGLAMAPTLAMIGERGPEVVIPLDKMGEVFNSDEIIYELQLTRLAIERRGWMV